MNDDELPSNFAFKFNLRHYAERAHFYFRRRIRGVREVFFYSLPAGAYTRPLFGST
jgi:hypothetical protein